MGGSSNIGEFFIVWERGGGYLLRLRLISNTTRFLRLKFLLTNDKYWM